MKVLTKKRKITKYIVMTAVFAALGYILSFLEIPMPGAHHVFKARLFKRHDHAVRIHARILLPWSCAKA